MYPLVSQTCLTDCHRNSCSDMAICVYYLYGVGVEVQKQHASAVVIDTLDTPGNNAFAAWTDP